MKAKKKLKLAEGVKTNMMIEMTPPKNKRKNVNNNENNDNNDEFKGANKKTKPRRKQQQQQQQQNHPQNKRKYESSPLATEIDEGDWDGDETVKIVIDEDLHADSEERSEAEIAHILQKTLPVTPS